MTNPKIQERVRKLLALARNNPNVNEAAVAFARAQEIATAAGLDLDDVDADGEPAPQPEPVGRTITRRVVDFGGKCVAWKGTLVGALALANGCDAYMNGKGVFVYGQPRDVETVAGLAPTMVEAVDYMAREAVKRYKVDPEVDSRWDASPRAYGSSFRVGCVHAISTRLKPIKTIIAEKRKEIEAAEAPKPGALVRVDAALERHERVQQVLAETRKSLRLRSSHSSAGRGSSRGYSDGRNAGSSMALGGSKALR